MISERAFEELANISVVAVAEQVLDWASFTKAGSEWQGPCPWHGQTKDGKSFAVHERKNVAYCHKCERGTNAIGLVQAALGHNFPEAAKYLAYGFAQHLIDEVDGKGAYRPPKDTPVVRPLTESLPKGKIVDDKSFRRLRAIFKETTTLDKNPVVMKYLYRRRLTRIDTERCKGVLRAHPGLFNVDSKQKHPALVARITDELQETVGLEILWLSDEGYKLDVPIPRKMRKCASNTRGDHILLYPSVSGIYVIGEGKESVLSYYQEKADTEMGLVSLMSKGNYKKYTFPKHALRFHVACDPDDNDRRAIEDLEDGESRKGSAGFEDRARAAGIECFRYYPMGRTERSDWNDILVEESENFIEGANYFDECKKTVDFVNSLK